MALEALILSKDSAFAAQAKRAMESAGLEVQQATAPGQALSLMAKHKFDALALDVDDVADARDVLEAIRKGKSNKSAITFAIINGKTTVKEAYELGANFVLEKPVTADRWMRSLKAAHGLIQRERRRYMRIQGEADVYLAGKDGIDVHGALDNISETGMRLHFGGKARPQGQINVKVILKGARLNLEGKGEMAWLSPDGTAGVRFLSLTPASRAELERWLNERVNTQTGPRLAVR